MLRLSTHVAAVLLCASSALSAVEIQEVETPLGIQAWLVEEHTIPFTALKIRFRTGSILEPDEKAGSTYLMTGLLEEGAADLDAVEFAKQVELNGAVFGYDSYTETVVISVQFVTERRDESIELLRKALQEPRFDQDAFERVRDQVFAILEDDLKDPYSIGYRALDSTLFGDHPYSRPHKGTQETVAGLTTEDMHEAHRRSLVRDQVVVAAAGDITADELADLVDRLLGGLPESKDVDVPNGKVISEEATTEFVEFPSPQSVIIFGHEGFLRQDPDFLAAYVLNEIMGSSDFQARLQQAVRVERGLTYGIGTYMTSFRDVGLVLGSFATSNETVDEAIAVVREEWESIAQNGVTEKELREMKTYLKGAYALRFDGSSAIAGILASMQFEYIPASYVAERNDLVEALTLEHVNEVARRLYHPDMLKFVVVGQRLGEQGSDSADGQ